MQEEQDHKHHEERGIFDGAMHAMELGLSSITGRHTERKSRGAVLMVAKAAAPQILAFSLYLCKCTKAAWCRGGPGGMGPCCQVLLSAG